MLALIIAVALSSPPTFDCEDGQVVCPFTPAGRRCFCAPEMINLGSWDPRPTPDEWPKSSYYGTEPAAWGTYPLEKSVP